jgi:hypothetical protein
MKNECGHSVSTLIYFPASDAPTDRVSLFACSLPPHDSNGLGKIQATIQSTKSTRHVEVLPKNPQGVSEARAWGSCYLVEHVRKVAACVHVTLRSHMAAGPFLLEEELLHACMVHAPFACGDARCATAHFTPNMHAAHGLSVRHCPLMELVMPISWRVNAELRLALCSCSCVAMPFI